MGGLTSNGGGGSALPSEFRPVSPAKSNPWHKGAHYQLLLRMQDEEGCTVLPGDFCPLSRTTIWPTNLTAGSFQPSGFVPLSVKQSFHTDVYKDDGRAV